MALYDIVAADLALIHADANGPAIVVTHVTAAGVQTTNIKARFDRESNSEPNFDDGKMKTMTGTLIITVAALAAVALEDSFLIPPIGGGSAETWKVTDIPTENPAFRQIAVTRTAGRRWATTANEHDRAVSDGRGRGSS